MTQTSLRAFLRLSALIQVWSRSAGHCRPLGRDGAPGAPIKDNPENQTSTTPLLHSRSFTVDPFRGQPVRLPSHPASPRPHHQKSKSSEKRILASSRQSAENLPFLFALQHLQQPYHENATVAHRDRRVSFKRSKMDHPFDATTHTKQYVNAVINYKARAKTPGHEIKGHLPRKSEVHRKANSRRSDAASIFSTYEANMSDEQENKLVKDRAIITRQLMQLESKMPGNPIAQFFSFLTPHSIANNLILMVNSGAFLCVTHRLYSFVLRIRILVEPTMVFRCMKSMKQRTSKRYCACSLTAGI